jgi:hypothetical protein
VENDIEQEEWGQETDDWMMEETQKEFISFRDSPGSLTMLFHGKPVKGRSKYQKDQYWFNVEVVTLIEGQDPMVEEKTLSTSSNQIRKKLTKLVKDYPDILEGKRPVFLQWSGNGMDRSYSMNVLSYGSACALMESIDRTPPSS